MAVDPTVWESNKFPLSVLFPRERRATPPLTGVGPRPETVSPWLKVVPPLPPSSTSIPPLKPRVLSPCTENVRGSVPSWPAPRTTNIPPLTATSPVKLEALAPPNRNTPSPVFHKVPEPPRSPCRLRVVPNAVLTCVSPLRTSRTLESKVTGPVRAPRLIPPFAFASVPPRVSVFADTASRLPP